MLPPLSMCIVYISIILTSELLLFSFRNVLELLFRLLKIVSEVNMFSNNFATLTEHKVSKRKTLTDYVIRFHSKQDDINVVMRHSFDIVKQLVEDYQRKDVTIKGRLVTLVNYVHTINENTVSYYHSSFQNEVIDNVEDFFYSHMLKIAERIENFSHHGSNLLIKNIEEIHLHITVIN